jgi:hypothetical protein
VLILWTCRTVLLSVLASLAAVPPCLADSAPDPGCVAAGAAQISCSFESAAIVGTFTGPKGSTTGGLPGVELKRVQVGDELIAYQAALHSASDWCVRFSAGTADFEASFSAPILRDPMSALGLFALPNDSITPVHNPEGFEICHVGPPSPGPAFSLAIGRRANVEQLLFAQPKAVTGRLSPVLAKNDRKVETGSYVMVPVTAKNAPRVINWAVKGGFQYILIPVGAWAATYGTYDINGLSFPGGLDELRGVVSLAHRLGVSIGLHVLTALVSKDDPLVRARPDQLLTAVRGTIRSPVEMQSPASQIDIYGDGLIPDLQSGPLSITVDGELMVCAGNQRVGPQQLRVTACVRGANGTRPERHAAGARAGVLVERSGSFVADLKTPVRDLIAGQLGHVLNSVRADMVYFDAGEISAANGDPYFFVADQQLAVLGQVHGTLLVEGSGMVPRLWPYVDRVPMDDFAALATVEYLDSHKIGETYPRLTAKLMPSQLGWIGLLRETPAYNATTVEEMSSYMARSIALGIPFSVETTELDLDQNPYSSRLLQMFAAANKAVQLGDVPGALRSALATDRWYFQAVPHPAFSRILLEKRLRIQSGDGVHNEWRLPSGAHGVFMRIADLSSSQALADPQSDLRIVSPEGKDDVVLREPLAGQFVRGGLASRLNFSSHGALTTSKVHDLSKSRRIVVDYQYQQAVAPPSSSCSVLDIQLQDGGGHHRDYLLDLREGPHQKVVLDFNQAAPRLITERLAVDVEGLKDSIYVFDFSRVSSVTARWVRSCAPGSTLRLSSMQFVPENIGHLDRVDIRLDGTQILATAGISSGATLDLFPDGTATVCVKGQCRELSTKALPHAEQGGSTLSVTSTGDASYDLVVGAIGAPLTLPVGGR